MVRAPAMDHVLDHGGRVHLELSIADDSDGVSQSTVSTIQANWAVCSYCGLPAPAPLWGGDADAGPRYCCYGCRFAAKVSSASVAGGESSLMFTRLGIAIFCTMNVMAF